MTPEELRAAGFTDQEIAAYQSKQTPAFHVTGDDAKKAGELIQAGFSEQEIAQYFQNRQKPPVQQQQPKQPSQPQSLSSKLIQRGKNIANEYGNVGKMIVKGSSGSDPLRPTLNVLSEVAGGFGDVAGSALKTGYENLVSKDTKDLIAKGTKFVKDNTPIDNWISAVYNQFVKAGEHNPQAGKDIKAYWNVAGGMPGIGATGIGAKTLAREGRAVVRDVGTLSSKKVGGAWIDPAVEQQVKKGMQKGIAGTARGKSNAAALAEPEVKAHSAVVDVVNNKGNLRLTGETGDTISGQVPKTVRQMSEALYQTKANIWKEVDARLKQATGKGAIINMDHVADAMDDMARRYASNPEMKNAAVYAAEKAADYRGKILTPGQVEETLEKLNHDLTSYFFDRSKGSSIIQKVDLERRKIIHDLLDKTMNQYGPDFQDLKGRWGSIKQIERDVAHRAQVTGRQKMKGLLDFQDVWSTPELVHGLITANPAQVTKALGTKAVAKYYKWLNSNDRAVGQMFDTVDKLVAKKQAIESPFYPTSRVGKVAMGLNDTPVGPHQSLVPTGIRRDIFPTRGSLREINEAEMPSWYPVRNALPPAQIEPQLGLALGITNKQAEAEIMRGLRQTGTGGKEFSGVPTQYTGNYAPRNKPDDFLNKMSLDKQIALDEDAVDLIWKIMNGQTKLPPRR